ncbi:MAG: DNA-formamidopyrimidine glycosylase family protein [Pseudomonadota bacterium]
MPEIPDLDVYIDAINERLTDSRLQRMAIASPFLLRTVEPKVEDLLGRRLVKCRRMAKQLVFQLEDDYAFVIHLMISGRLQFSANYKPPPKRNGLAAFEFSAGTLIFTEVSKKKRASLRLVHGKEDLEALNPGGLEVQQASLNEFDERLRSHNHTLKRALTDQRIFAGIGNAYSDEILLEARLSPFKQSGRLKPDEVEALYLAIHKVLDTWRERLRDKAKGKFPTKVTAFHPEMKAHGKYRESCLDCGAPIQRIVYAENEANYCAKCQTAGKLLADRSLSRLLKDNWPKTLEDLETP